MTNFFYWLGDLFQASFTVLPMLGNYVNLLLVGLFSIAFFISLKKFI
tara:strand:+ start:432 stop:572 length:141 start_codon:yes stop_codon:yes gene_type:complete